MKNKINIQVLAPIFLVFFLFISTLILFYPGGMSGDSLDQWRQLVNWNINSWHPPAMVYMWQLWSYLFYGPFAMLFFHALVYWLAIYLFVVVAFKSTIMRCIFVVLLGVFPPVLLLVGTIWKDTSLMVSFFFAFSIILYIDQFKKSKLLLVFPLFFIAYAASVRHNALIASLPLLFLIFHVLFPQSKRWVASLVTVISFVVLGVAIHQFNAKMVHNKTYHIENSIFFWDLWGMSIDQNKNLMPDYLFHREEAVHRSKRITVDELKEYYSPTCNTVIWPTTTGLRGDRYYPSFPDKKFKKDFLQAIWDYPESYYLVRSRVVTCLLGITCNNFQSGAWLDITQFPEDHYLHKYANELSIGRYIEYPRIYQSLTTGFFRGWIYLAGIFIVFLAATGLYWKRPKSFYLYSSLISISGLLYWSPYLVVATCHDFRYNTWMILAFLLSALLFLCGLFDRENATDGKHLPVQAN